MRFTCESCGAQYMISDEKVGPTGVRVRCKKCSEVIRVRRADAPGPEAAPEATPAQAAPLGAAPVDATPTPTPSEGTSEWYVAIDDRQVGPLPSAALRTRWDAGEIGPDTLAWRAGMGDWLPVSSIPDLTRRLSPSAQPRSGASQDTGIDAAGVTAQTSGDVAAVANTVVNLANGATQPVSNGVSNGVSSRAVNGASNGALNGKLNGKAITWQPSAGSALASLASEELIAAEQKVTPAPVASAVPAAAASAAEAPRSGASLLDNVNIPEGGVDPTHLIPLQMKGLERTTEVALKPKHVAEHEPTQIRQLRKSAKRSGIAWGVAVASLAAVAIAGGLWFLNRAPEMPAAPVAQAPAAQPPAEQRPVAAPAPAAAAPAETAPVTPPPSAAPVAESAAPSATPPATAAAPQPQAAPAPSEPAAAVAEAPRPEKQTAKHVAKAEPPASKPKPPRVAAKERNVPPAPVETRPSRPAAAPAPVAAAPAAVADAPRKKSSGDPLLDVGGDDELEKELSAKPKRNVYVPPAIGSDLPDSVSVSQINEAVVGQKAALLRCIEEQRAVDPAARGTLKLRWIIGGDGATRDVRVTSEEFAKQPIAPCISNVVKGIRFPRSRTTGQEVVFPFKF